MADLSNLLGAVYGEGSTEPGDPDGPAVPVEPAASERVPAVPDWADDEALDAAFAQWKPGAAHENDNDNNNDNDNDNDKDNDNDDDDDEDGDEGDLHSVVLRLNQRAAAAELTEASRFGDEPEAAVAVPAPTAERQPESVALQDPVALPKPESSSGLASLPYVSDDPTAAPGSPVFTEARQWERSDDDILPTKGGRRGFFSLSLRRG